MNPFFRFASRLPPLAAVLLPLTSCLSLAANTVSNDDVRVLSILDQQADLQFLFETIEDAHPDIRHIGKERYEKMKGTLIKKTAPTSALEFSERIQRFLHGIRDGHTVVNLQYPYRIPFALKLFENRVFIDGNLSTASDFNGNEKCEILTINKIPIQDYLKERLSFESYEKEEYGVLSVLKYKAMRFATDQPVKTTLLCKGLKAEKTFVPLRTKEVVSKSLDSTPFDFQMTRDSSVGVLSFRSFEDRTYCFKEGCDKLPSMQEVISKAVHAMSSNGTKVFVIDIRNNSGGASRVAEPIYDAIAKQPVKDWQSQIKYSKTYLRNGGEFFPGAKLGGLVNPRLKYGSDGTYKPKGSEKFNGKVIVLMNRGTYSSANMFAYILADNHLAVTTGEPPGNGGCKFGDAKNFTLPYSGVSVQYAYKRFMRPESKFCDLGNPELAVDHPFIEKADDYLKGKDSMMEFVLTTLIH